MNLGLPALFRETPGLAPKLAVDLDTVTFLVESMTFISCSVKIHELSCERCRDGFEEVSIYTYALYWVL